MKQYLRAHSQIKNPIRLAEFLLLYARTYSFWKVGGFSGGLEEVQWYVTKKIPGNALWINAVAPVGMEELYFGDAVRW